VNDLDGFMSRIKNSIESLARLFFRVSCVLSCSFRLVSSEAISAATPPVHLEQCRSNLAAIFIAIQHYRRDNHRLPNELRDLVPKYLPNDSFLKCPAGQPAPDWQSVPLNREQVTATAGYVYEFEQTPLTNALAQGLGITLQSWRQLQMGRIGSELPIVRCTNHVRVLNLSFGGEIRESGPEWESDFARVAHPQELSLDFLLQDYMRLKVVRIPAREPSAPPELVDLTRYYNGSLTGWMEVVEDKALADFRTDRTVIDGVSFDIRGVIQLASENYSMLNWPAYVTNIAVGLHCEGLAFLHGTVNAEADGVDVSNYIVHFENGSTNVLPITYGVHLLDWKEFDPEKIQSRENKQKSRASGKTSVVQKGGTRLYVYYWTNPYPDLRIQCIDFVSSMTESSPFLVAVTAVPPKQVEEKTAGP
jgi:hypothetical protein